VISKSTKFTLTLNRDFKMVNTYPYLLKNIENKQFGISTTDLIVLSKKGQVMSTKKLIVVYNGEEYAPVDCKEVSVQFQKDTITLNIVTLEDTKIQTEESPSTDTVVTATKDEIFLLKGDDLEAFTTLSEFRWDENHCTPSTGIKREAHIIESETYDIQDLQSVQNATFDLIEAEKKFLNDNYAVIQCNTPRFIYEADKSHFKLTESVILCKKEVKTVNTSE